MLQNPKAEEISDEKARISQRLIDDEESALEIPSSNNVCFTEPDTRAEETYKDLLGLFDENTAGLIIEALTAKRISHVSCLWTS